MATLILKWPLTDGSGTELAETINGREMHFASVGSYPAWTTGPSGSANTAITTSGATDSTAYAATDEPYQCDYGTSGGITIVARHKLASTEGGTIINSFYLDAVNRPSAGNPADPLLNNQNGAYTTLQVSSGGSLRFGWSAARGATYYSPSTVIDTVSTGVWNTTIVRLTAPYYSDAYHNGAWYKPSNPTYRAQCLGWNDGGLTPELWLSSFMNQFWAIGLGKSAFFCGGSNRSFSGDIGECRVYCGAMTDAEIEDLYDELSGIVKAKGRPFIFSGGLA